MKTFLNCSYAAKVQSNTKKERATKGRGTKFCVSMRPACIVYGLDALVLPQSPFWHKKRLIQNAFVKSSKTFFAFHKVWVSKKVNSTQKISVFSIIQTSSYRSFEEVVVFPKRKSSLEKKDGGYGGRRIWCIVSVM